MSRRGSFLVTGLAVLALAVAACSGPATGTEIRSSAQLETSVPSKIPGAVAANSALATALYRNMAGRGGNFVFSPYGISVALAMAQSGASGSTASQLSAAQQSLPGQDLRPGLAGLAQLLSTRMGDQQNDLRQGRVSLELPVSLWGQKDSRFSPPFLDGLARWFDTGVRVVDFRSDPEAARRAMNGWVSDRTAGDIAELVPRGVITETTRLAATTAAYLHAPWEQRFDLARTRLAPFTRAAGQVVSTKMMELQSPSGLLYAKGDGWQAVELPYLGRQLAMVVIIPDAGRLAEFEGRLDASELHKIVRSLSPTPLDLRLPRFSFTTQGGLDRALSEMGAPAPFLSGTADFSGITADEALWISSFSHQTYVSVDEEGTDGSAVTVVPAHSTQVTPGLTSVTVDRPFAVMVMDRVTEEPLLFGRVTDPNS